MDPVRKTKGEIKYQQSPRWSEAQEVTKKNAQKEDNTNSKDVVQELAALTIWCEDNAMGIQNEKYGEWSVYQWFAPRVLMQYWERQTGREDPVQWSMDNYDGGTILG